MRAVIQRVSQARVDVDGKTAGAIKQGLLILLGVHHTDTEDEVKWLAEKCVNLRIFENAAGKFHHSLMDIGGDVLVVSQFTLYGDCRRGRRPGFSDAARPEKADPLYQKFVQLIRGMGVNVETGVFATHMDVTLTNDGPVTLIIDTPEK